MQPPCADAFVFCAGKVVQACLAGSRGVPKFLAPLAGSRLCGVGSRSAGKKPDAADWPEVEVMSA